MGVGYCGFGDEVWTEGFFGLIPRLDWMYEGLNLENLQNKWVSMGIRVKMLSDTSARCKIDTYNANHNAHQGRNTNARAL